jgi:hypothetical protein
MLGYRQHAPPDRRARKRVRMRRAVAVLLTRPAARPGLGGGGRRPFLIIELVIRNNFGLFKFELDFQNLVENKVKLKF